MNTSAPETVGLSPERLSRINQVMQDHVDQKNLPGIITMAARKGQIAHADCFGWMDMESRKPMQIDAIFRLASMTKPITSTAMMMLYEKGLFQLSDPVSKFIPEFKGLKVYVGMEDGKMGLVDSERDITIGDSLTFVSGLMGSLVTDPPLKELYEEINFSSQKDTLEEGVLKLTELPLMHQPGKNWSYGHDYTLLGRLVELISGKTFAEFLQEEIFEPLNMPDTGFFVPKSKKDRLTTLYDYTESADQPKVDDSPETSDLFAPPALTSGSGNLLSTTHDYMRFAQMLLNRGELEGKRLLSRKTVELMTENHLPGSLLPFGIPDYGANWSGYGYGFGFRVVMDVAQTKLLGSPGEYGWAGAYSTYFWIDPEEELVGIFMSQAWPPFHWPNLVSPDFKALVYQAIVD